jgi:nicotinate-nucleotide adenylyltransferase
VESQPPRLGVLGGTFDPPHLGHLILAESACDKLGLDQVLFVPAADPPHKHNLTITQIEHRLTMLAAAIGDNPRFALSDIDITRSGPHYTADTLRLLNEKYPHADLYFILGGDALRDLATWHEPAEIIKWARLAAMGRPGATLDLASIYEKLPGLADRLVFVNAPVIGISATLLRERLRAGHSIRYLVPDSVERYIMEHGLYRNGRDDQSVT